MLLHPEVRIKLYIQNESILLVLLTTPCNSLYARKDQYLSLKNNLYFLFFSVRGDNVSLFKKINQ